MAHGLDENNWLFLKSKISFLDSPSTQVARCVADHLILELYVRNVPFQGFPATPRMMKRHWALKIQSSHELIRLFVAGLENLAH